MKALNEWLKVLCATKVQSIHTNQISGSFCLLEICYSSYALLDFHLGDGGVSGKTFAPAWSMLTSSTCSLEGFLIY